MKLKLIKVCGQQGIETSTGFRITLKNALVAFSTFQNIIDKYKKAVIENKDFTHVTFFHDFCCGGYVVKDIRRDYVRDRVTSKIINKIDWSIKMGCTTIYLEDIIDFINYYKLNKEFNYYDV